MASFSNILKKAGAVVLAAGGLILAGKSGFGKNLGEPVEEKDPALEPLGGPKDSEEEKEPLEEKEEDGE